jgi:hypothetical protein
MEDTRNAYRILMGIPLEKRPLGRRGGYCRMILRWILNRQVVKVGEKHMRSGSIEW